MRQSFFIRQRHAGFIALILMGCMNIQKSAAQDNYIPFVEEGKIWYCGHEHLYDTPPVTPEDPTGLGIDCIFTMQGDTLISELSYKKVFCQYKEFFGDDSYHYFCAVREEDCRVYCVEKSMKEENLLYDFSCPEELLVLSYHGQEFGRLPAITKAVSHSSTIIKDFILCYLPVQDTHIVGLGVWIEGTGSVYGNPFAFELYGDKNILEPEIHVVYCKAGGDVIYRISWMAEPVNIGEQQAEKQSTATSLYDLQGRQLQGKPERGVYIQDGRKYVIK